MPIMPPGDSSKEPINLSSVHNISPLVSVVLCTYNGENFLRPQLDSILSQSWTNLELLIADDASTDQTVKILEEYRHKDPRVHYTVNPANLGYNRNFEKAFTAAAGEYIAISDQDDIWEREKLKRMMEHWPADSLFMFSLSGTFINRDFENRKPAPNVKYGPVTHLYQLVFNSPVHGHASMFKKELLKSIGPFPDTVYYDWWLSMHAVLQSELGCLPQTLSWHRLHEDNSSRQILNLADKEERNNKLRAQFIQALDLFFEQKKEVPEPDRFLITYNQLLKKTDGQHFSWPLFRLIMKNRKKIFHYKKSKPLLFFSELKHALRMARTGLL